MPQADGVTIRPYSEGDMWVLEKTLGDAEEMGHLNGPETREQIERRHKIYVGMSADRRDGCMFTVMVGGSAAGTVGYWESEWDGEKVWETGWFVLPQFQGRGVATQAMKLMIQLVKGVPGHRNMVAFPSTSNGPSNAVARKVGFDLVREIDSEYPKKSGKFLHNNAWRLDLQPPEVGTEERLWAGAEAATRQSG
ncbi:MAG: GNAT family N-acetyltransferase [Nitrososphaerota archaeon]|nr:GNAT family N-acetyltransferase [Nitrososphaerota archaeon]